jgi:mannosylglycerate hydrolase
LSSLYLVTHTHWDREWYQTFQQFRLRLVGLMDHLLDLLADDPDFKYFMLDGQTIVLDDYLQIRPEREVEIRNYVQQGRILIGPWYVLPDEFLVSPEAIIRNLLQGDRTGRDFGGKMRIGYIPDPFGHIGQMPQILHGFGIESASLWRGLSDQPAEFWWQSADGTKVFMAYLCNGYGNASGLPTSIPDQFVAEVGRLRDELLPRTATKEYVLLMHGSDHVVPPADTSTAIAYANQHLQGDVLLHSTLPAYVAAVQAKIQDLKLDLPNVSGELRACKRAPLLPGVLSARMWIKQRNRACETLLEKWAEPFSTWTRFEGGEKPGAAVVWRAAAPALRQTAPILRYAWRLLMENHPHDSICGCSIDQVHEEMRSRFDQVEQVGEEITRQSLDALAGATDTRADGCSAAVLVFNPAGGPRTDWVTVEVETPVSGQGFELVDQAGKSIPLEHTGMEAREIIYVSMSKEEMRHVFGMIRGGLASEVGFREFNILRQGDTVRILLVISETGEPDLEARERGLREMEKLLEDPEVATFVIQAHALPSSRVTFVATQVPGYGFRTYWVRPSGAPAAEPSAPARLNPLTRLALPLAGRIAQLPARLPAVARMLNRPKIDPQAEIENEFFSVSASPIDGTLSLRDRRSGVVFTGLNRFVDGGDCGDEYNFCPPPTDILVSTPRLRRLEVKHGAIQQTIEIELSLMVPRQLSPDRKQRGPETVVIPITTRISLTSGVPRLDIHTEVDNTARDHRLRVHFPVPVTAQHADFDGHFEIVRRPLALPAFDDTWVEQPRPEKPQRAFTSLSDGKIGLTITNRGLPEAEALQADNGQDEIAVTLLRCVGWLSRSDLTNRNGHAGPAEATPGAQLPGKHAFDYAILPQAGSSLPFEQAYAFQAPLRSVTTLLHEGALPAVSALVQASPPEFVISAIKSTEDESGWILRGYNLTGHPLQVKLTPWRSFNHVEYTNLVEEVQDVLIPDADGSVLLTVGGHAIVTLKFS